MDIDKKIAANELLIDDCGLSKEGYRQMARRLINQLKECRVELSECKKIVVGLDEGSVKLTSVEQRTKDAVWEAIEELPVTLGLISKALVKLIFRQAIDSVGKK